MRWVVSRWMQCVKGLEARGDCTIPYSNSMGMQKSIILVLVDHWTAYHSPQPPFVVITNNTTKKNEEDK
jgi:hypothetical protein